MTGYKTFYGCLCLLMLCGSTAFSQVKIGNNPTIVNPNAILEIESNNKGLLLPRLALAATTSPYPLTTFVEGMLVYDTATVADITPGLYYCDGTQWIRLGKNGGNGTSISLDSAWKLTGNNGTSPNTHYIGTGDRNDLVFKTNGIERLRLTKNGWLGVGTANPEAALQVKGQVVIDSLQMANLSKDSVNIVVATPNGRLKVVPPWQISASVSVKKAHFVVSITGQRNFETPATISEPDKVLLFRNGVMINFSVLGPTTIEAEVATVRGDEIKIVQTL
jgi:hypothetical protein